LLAAGAASFALAGPAHASTGVCGTPVVSGATTTITCAAGGTGTITVPSDVASGTATLEGAGGGVATDGTAGGKGALLVATLALTPGQVLDIAVGDQGLTYSGDAGNRARAAAWST
jgi:hypothetical protein